MKYFTFFLMIFMSCISKESFSVSMNGVVEADIVSELEISEDSSIYLGTISTDGTGDTVAIDSSDNITCPSSMNCDGVPQSGRYTIVGAPDAEVNLDVHESVLSTSSGTDTLSFVPSVGLGESRTLDGSGSYSLEIGGTMNVGANQEQGTYSTSNTGGSPMLIDVSY